MQYIEASTCWIIFRVARASAWPWLLRPVKACACFVLASSTIWLDYLLWDSFIPSTDSSEAVEEDMRLPCITLKYERIGLPSGRPSFRVSFRRMISSDTKTVMTRERSDFLWVNRPSFLEKLASNAQSAWRESRWHCFRGTRSPGYPWEAYTIGAYTMHAYGAHTDEIAV